MKIYRLCIGQQIGYKHPFPERTVKISGLRLDDDDIFKVFPSREKMIEAVKRKPHCLLNQQGLMPLVPFEDSYIK